MATARDIRYQAVVAKADALLLVKCAFRDGRTQWMLPGGGRDDGETEKECVAREVAEETTTTVIGRKTSGPTRCYIHNSEAFATRWRVERRIT
jgi:ADP-ribose pyrophosphatase YjhB (NUDIX family)